MLVFYCSYFQMATYINLTSNIFHSPSMLFLSAELYTSAVFKHFIFLIVWCWFAFYNFLEYIIDKYILFALSNTWAPSGSGGTEILPGAVLLVVSAGFSAEVQARINVTLSNSRVGPSGLGNSVLVALGLHCWAQYLQTWNSGCSTGMLQPGHKHEGAARIYVHLYCAESLKLRFLWKGEEDMKMKLINLLN